MKGWTGFVVLALFACSAGDDTADGARALCAEGGALNDCPDRPRTAQEACWRMVDCGAIPLVRTDDDAADDWDDCVEDIQSMLSPQQEIAIACIGASTCDQLRLDNDRCFYIGGN